MRMKNPPHPGRIIADALTELEVTIVDAAAAIGTSRQQLHNIISGRSGVAPEMAYRLEKAIGSTAETWLTMQMNYDLARVQERAVSIQVRSLVSS